MPSLPLATAHAAKDSLRLHLIAEAIVYSRVALHVNDDGLGLLVYAPTQSHPQIPQEWEGFRVIAREPLPHMHSWGCGTSCPDFAARYGGTKKSDDPV